MLVEISVSKFWIEIGMEIFQILYLSLYCTEKYYKFDESWFNNLKLHTWCC
jgi:hypothetical protein